MLKEWAMGQEYYYIKRASIVETIEHDGRTFYAKFEQIDDELTDKLTKQHLSRESTLAVPITKNNHSEHIFFIYDGESPESFVHLFEHLMSNQGITNYRIFNGKTPHRRIASIKLHIQSISTLHLYAKDLSNIMEKNMTKNWKILPDPSLPKSYNIITLPYIN
jgi:hypothetical protein